jgi:hypothetical protein
MKHTLYAALLFFACSAVSIKAVVVVSTDFQTGPGGVGSTFTPTYTIPANDLLNGRTPIASSGNFAAVELSGGLPVMTDGVFGIITEPGGAADRTHAAFGLGGGGSGTGTSVTYGLNLSLAPQGYDISSIVSLGGWNDNGRDQQLFTVFYSTVASPNTFLQIGAPVNFNPNVAANIQSATMVTISDSANAALAVGVGALRFDFPAGVENGYTAMPNSPRLGARPCPSPPPRQCLRLPAALWGAADAEAEPRTA